jgi:hypothetical protein
VLLIESLPEKQDLEPCDTEGTEAPQRTFHDTMIVEKAGDKVTD